MSKREIRIKVPEILKAKGLSDYDLMYGSRITLNTAKRWADSESSKEISRVDFNTLISIADYLEVDDMNDLLEFVNNE